MKKKITDYQCKRNKSKPKYWQSVSTVDSLNKYTFKCILTYLSNSAPVADIAWLGFRDIARRHVQTPLESTFCFPVGQLWYSSVPNRRLGRNKRAGGKILKKH